VAVGAAPEPADEPVHATSGNSASNAITGASDRRIRGR
jgi:hypothetical protein